MSVESKDFSLTLYISLINITTEMERVSTVG